MQLIAWSVFIVAILPQVGAERVPRSDDGDYRTLEAIVHQQASTIQTLQTRLAAVETTVQGDFATVKTKVDNLQSQADKTVAFSAHMSGFDINVGSNAPFKFDVVVTNIGGAYNGHNGIFLAPHAGVYVFYFDMMDDGSAHWIHAAIEKSGTILAVTSADGSPNAYDKGSVLVSTHLNKGDQVFVRRIEGGTSIEGYNYCNFSGFLLKADA